MRDNSADIVSVIIPAYNASSTIAEALRSAQTQTYSSLDIVVVDDGSQDDTAAIVTNIAREDPRIVLIQQPNAGVAAARNRSLAASKGGFIAPLDADDIWHCEKIERQMKRLIGAGSDTGLVYCWSADIDEQGLIVKYRLNLDRFEGQVYAALVLANFIGSSSVPLIRRNLLEEICGWDTDLRAKNAQGCEDWLLYLRLAERTKFAVTPAFLVGYRQIAGGMSRNISRMRRSFALVMTQARAAHPELPNALFRWSRAEFGFYVAQLCWSSNYRGAALWFALRACALDPEWLNRRSTRELFRTASRRLKAKVVAAVRRVNWKDTAQLPYPIGRPFCSVCPEPEYALDDGPVAVARRRYVASLQIARKKSGADNLFSIAQTHTK